MAAPLGITLPAAAAGRLTKVLVLAFRVSGHDSMPSFRT
jgi:hypothetical protein